MNERVGLGFWTLLECRGSTSCQTHCFPGLENVAVLSILSLLEHWGKLKATWQICMHASDMVDMMVWPELE